MLQIVPSLINAVLAGAKKATKYYSTNEVVKATYHGKRYARARAHHVVVTIGKPNYAEREFIKKAIRAGEPFPIKKVQLHTTAKRRK